MISAEPARMHPRFTILCSLLAGILSGPAAIDAADLIFDANGNRTVVEDANHTKTQTEYDALGRRIEKTVQKSRRWLFITDCGPLKHKPGSCISPIGFGFT